MLQITGLYASLLAVLIIYLAFRVAMFRLTNKVGLGDKGDYKTMKLIRVHANAVEYVPTLLILMGIYEVNGGSSMVLNILGALAVLARILHAFGLSKSSGFSIGRSLGTVLTFVIVIAFAGLNIYHYFN